MHIVTGGTHGIGRACVLQLAAEGRRVIFTGRDRTAGEALAREATGAHYIESDVASEDDCCRVVATATAKGGGAIAGLVNNAGISVRVEFADSTAADWDRIFAVNARSAYLYTRLAPLPYRRRNAYPNSSPTGSWIRGDSTMQRIPLAIIGAGLIGRTHLDRAMKSPNVRVVGIADPSESARLLAESVGRPWFAEAEDLLDATRPRGAVIATPNATHAHIAVRCLERGCAVLIEKPIADSVEDAERICRASESAGVPAIVGHQRRHNPITRRARSMIDAGALGRPVCATAMATWLKPADYFDTRWRREKGGGPILINLIHDVDQLRFLFGDIAGLQAVTSNAIRKFEVEDTAAVLLQFRNGALGTLTLSDAAAAPWNWDLAAGEAERFPRQQVDSHFLSGTEGSLTLPGLAYWHYRGRKGWQDEITEERAALHSGDPFAEQMRHFCSVIDGKEKPLSPAVDATQSLRATLAVATAGASGNAVAL